MKKLSRELANNELISLSNEVASMFYSKSYKKIKDREDYFKNKGYNIVEKAAGTGGVSSIKEDSSYYYVQIGCGHGKYNYASLIQISK